MKHKHCEVIKAWADGAVIQFEVHGVWHDVEYNNPAWTEQVNYRVKPGTKEFRLAKMRAEAGSECINLCFSRESEKAFERKAVFIKWLTDWKEVEV